MFIIYCVTTVLAYLLSLLGGMGFSCGALLVIDELFNHNGGAPQMVVGVTMFVAGVISILIACALPTFA